MEHHEHPTPRTDRPCDEMKARLSAYLDDELSRDDRLRADTHLVGCAECRGLLDRAEELDRTIREECGLEPGSIDTADMQARVFAELGVRQPRRWLHLTAIAAALVALAAVGFAVLQDGGARAASGPDASKLGTLANLDAEERQLLYSTSVILTGLRRPHFESTDDFARFQGVARYDEIVSRLDALLEKLPPEDKPTVVLARRAIECLVESSVDPTKLDELRRDMEQTELDRRLDGLSEV